VNTYYFINVDKSLPADQRLKIIPIAKLLQNKDLVDEPFDIQKLSKPPKSKKSIVGQMKSLFGYDEGGLVDTGKKTVSGRTIWNDGGQDYSERTTTFQIGNRFYTMPTVAEDGSQYSDDVMKDYVEKYGPIDFITGEELPTFATEKEAIMYAIERSDTRKGTEQ